jgi:hypothetical protein
MAPAPGEEAVSYRTRPGDRDAGGRQPPGWYPDPRSYLDPGGQQVLRWWDGARWGQETHPPVMHPPQPYGQRPRESSIAPAPQYGAPAAQSPFRAQSYEPPYQSPHPGLRYGYGRQPPRPNWAGRWARNSLIAIGAMFVAGFVTGTVMSHGRDVPAASPADSPAAAASAAASSSPAGSPAASTVATFTGSGQENTPRFTVTSTWKLVYSFNCSDLGQAGNFAVLEDGGADYSGVSADDLAVSKSASTWGYDDAGTHYLQIDSECAWKVQVVDEP